MGNDRERCVSGSIIFRILRSSRVRYRLNGSVSDRSVTVIDGLGLRSMGGQRSRGDGKARRSPDYGRRLIHNTASGHQNDNGNDKKEADNANQCDDKREERSQLMLRRNCFVLGHYRTLWEGYLTLRDYGIFVIVNWLFIVAIVAVVEAEGRVAQLKFFNIVFIFWPIFSSKRHVITAELQGRTINNNVKLCHILSSRESKNITLYL